MEGRSRLEGQIEFTQRALIDRLCAFGQEPKFRDELNEIQTPAPGAKTVSASGQPPPHCTRSWGRLLISDDKTDNIDKQHGLHGTASALIAVMEYWLQPDVRHDSSWKQSHLRKFVVAGMEYLRRPLHAKDEPKTMKRAELLLAEVMFAKCEAKELSPQGQSHAKLLSDSRIGAAWDYRSPPLAGRPAFLLPTMYVANAIAAAVRLEVDISPLTRRELDDCVTWLDAMLVSRPKAGSPVNEERQCLRQLLKILKFKAHLTGISKDRETPIGSAEALPGSAPDLALSISIQYQLKSTDANTADINTYCALPRGLIEEINRAIDLLTMSSSAPISNGEYIAECLQRIQNAPLQTTHDYPHAIDLLALLMRLASKAGDTAVAADTGFVKHQATAGAGKTPNLRRRLLRGGGVAAAAILGAWLVARFYFKSPDAGSPTSALDTDKLDGGKRSSRVGARSTWISYEDSATTDSTVVVFVHGIQLDKDAEVFTAKGKLSWPKQVAVESFGASRSRVNVFLVRHSARLYLTGEASIADYASTVLLDLENPHPTTGHAGSKRSVLEHKNIVFVCHSLGGLLVRQMLVERSSLFKGKRVGLFLVASPTSGSQLATVAERLAPGAVSSAVADMKTQSQFLTSLNGKFRLLVETPSDLTIVGQELFEAGQVGLPIVVSRSLSDTFFPNSVTIDNTDHSSIAQPDPDAKSFSHDYLRKFVGDFVDAARSK